MTDTVNSHNNRHLNTSDTVSNNTDSKHSKDLVTLRKDVYCSNQNCNAKLQWISLQHQAHLNEIQSNLGQNIQHCQ